jgi:hypothetical protein
LVKNVEFDGKLYWTLKNLKRLEKEEEEAEEEKNKKLEIYIT